MQINVKLSSHKYLFDTSGRLIKITDENGNGMEITYSSGRMAYVTDGAGCIFEFSFDERSGLLTAFKAPDGSKVVYNARLNDILTPLSYLCGICVKHRKNIPVLLPASHTAGIRFTPLVLKFEQNIHSLVFVDGSVYMFEISRHRFDVLVAHIFRGRTNLMNDAALYLRFREYCVDRLSEACQAVNAEYIDVFDATVSEIVHHRQPELRTLVLSDECPCDRPSESRERCMPLW